MNYFEEALRDFTQDAASGGAIRHLADLGYTARQIADTLDFPTPVDQIQKVMWRHFLEEGVILLQEPEGVGAAGKAVFVKEYGAYGRTSFRRVTRGGAFAPREICWQEYRYQPFMGAFPVFLQEKCGENGEESAYASLEPGRYREHYACLDAREAEYLEGLQMCAGVLYHRLNGRMRRILCELYERDAYDGTLYFPALGERIRCTGKEDKEVLQNGAV